MVARKRFSNNVIALVPAVLRAKGNLGLWVDAEAVNTCGEVSWVGGASSMRGISSMRGVSPMGGPCSNAGSPLDATGFVCGFSL